MGVRGCTGSGCEGVYRKGGVGGYLRGGWGGVSAVTVVFLLYGHFLSVTKSGCNQPLPCYTWLA